jgi:transcriptional regulator with XRE-family HTH domain
MILDILGYVGEKLKQRILKGGYETVELFAHEHGIPKSTLSELLSGKNDPRLTTLLKICAALEMTPADFLKDHEIDLWVPESAPRYHARTKRVSRPGKKSKKPR